MFTRGKMQRHIESTLKLPDVNKKVVKWAYDNDFNETNSTSTKESSNVIFTKNYGKSLKFHGGIFIGFLLIGIIVGVVAQGGDKSHQKKSSIIEQQRSYPAGNMGAFQEGFDKGLSATLGKWQNPSPQKTAGLPTDFLVVLVIMLFPGMYIVYYYYNKNIGMKFLVKINTLRTDGKTSIQINSESDFQELKNDITKLNNNLVDV
jgi:hypothetical protein